MKRDCLCALLFLTIGSTLFGQTPVITGISNNASGAAAIYYVSPGQLNVQAPTDTATGPVQVEVTNSAGSASGTATLQNYSPAFFTIQAKYAAAVHNTDGVYVAPAGSFGSAATSRPAQPGEWLQIYATGLGPTTPAVPAGQLVGKSAPLSDLTQLRVTIGGVATSRCRLCTHSDRFAPAFTDGHLDPGHKTL